MKNFTWRDVAELITSIGIGYTINVLSDSLSVLPKGKLYASLILITCLAVYLVIVFTRKVVTQVATYTQTILRSESEVIRNARKGLIVVLPLYFCPGKPNTPGLIKRARSGDYAGMDFEKSNFAHVVHAILVNSSKLSTCWIISTGSANPKSPGSVDFAPALVKYLQEKKGIGCIFNMDEVVPLNDDSLITQKTREVVERIFTLADNIGIQEREMIADCTGGPRSMTLGIFLACLDSKRDIQFIGTHYDQNGRPTGEMNPMITKFSVKTVEERTEDLSI